MIFQVIKPGIIESAWATSSKQFATFKGTYAKKILAAKNLGDKTQHDY